MNMNLPKALAFSRSMAVALSLSIRGGTEERELRTRIIGGNEAAEGRYPYAVSLQDDVGHFCGGSLVAPDVVLSAAHCMQREGGYRAVVGRRDLGTSSGDAITVREEIAHPGYDRETTDNDFMILVLDGPVEGDVDLVEVSNDVVAVGTAVTVMGWGDTHPADDIQTLADELMETEVMVISNEECQKSEGTVGGTAADGSFVGGYEEDYHGQITDNMMCARDDAEDSCQGDSGGPLVIRSSDGDMQVGVVSWGVSCAHEDFPGVYARVSAQYEWIRENVCERSSRPPSWFDCEGRVEVLAPGGVAAAGGAQHEGGWTTMVKEDFARGMGLFGSRDNVARHYKRAVDRAGVVRIAAGEDGIPALKSNPISLEGASFSRIKASFSFYASDFELSGDLCMDYDLDDGAITGEKCWSNLLTFDNDRWYDAMSFEFAAADARSLKVGFRVKGDNESIVLIDSVTIQGGEQ